MTVIRQNCFCTLLYVRNSRGHSCVFIRREEEMTDVVVIKFKCPLACWSSRGGHTYTSLIAVQSVVPPVFLQPVTSMTNFAKTMARQSRICAIRGCVLLSHAYHPSLLTPFLPGKASSNKIHVGLLYVVHHE